MTTKTLHRPLRTAEVARRAGCSVQLVRNLERDGVLESAARTPSGYRAWTEIHALAAATYVVLAAGVGAAEAKRFLRVARAGTEADVLALVDMAHARLHAERRDVELAGDAVAAISAETLGDVRPGDAMTISELAAALAVPTSTLRYWDRQGLLTPARAGGGHARVYAPADVRDARIVHQLRLAGYRIPPLQALLPALRQHARTSDITAALRARVAHINSRSRALLQAAPGLLTLASSIEPKAVP
ncbi:DNA-binding transcriptional MerR regulator [Pseudosporangium ferrugineum]|uniref:DNA-binding transcriptional MerR regulator n=2 Tax=Pseudosporangium ferrugineum TaxID=439699 RepID=A0A2T0SAU5_9ACTN|nr:DNA-binding transcriptional MerR regulator [Pseudosporangium ferrugineum]